MKQMGVSLLETLLALAIIAALLVIGMRMYTGWVFMTNVQKIKNNVDQLFGAMDKFYLVNCRGGRLDPNISAPAVNENLAMNITTDLVTPRLLTGWKPINALVDNAKADTQNGYSVTFRRLANNRMNAFYCFNFGTTTCNSTSIDNTTVVRYMAVVTVSLRRVGEAQAVMNMLSANSIASGDVTWERMPLSLYANDQTNWLRESHTRAFRQQYTNDNMAAISGIRWNNSEFYLCGG